MNANVDTLNQQHGLPGHLHFGVGHGGLPCADVATPLATARIYLQGAHVAQWQPRGASAPVLWLSEDATFAAGKAIRGGVPVCWPWFGPHPHDASRPAHGIARTVEWHVAAARLLDDGRVSITFELPADRVASALWPHPFRLVMQATVGLSLELELATTNTGAAPFEFGEALHAYFQIGDIGTIHVDGLDGTAYVDKVDADQSKRQHGSVRFNGEVDRVYDDVASACVIVDPGLGRRITVAKQGSASTVVWSPGVAKAQRLGDLGAGRLGQGGWREMVCVESANALARRITLAPGATHRLAVEYSVANTP